MKENSLKNLKPFQKGNKNSKGRPKGSLNRSTLIKQWLKIKIESENPFTNKIENLTLEDLIVLGMIEGAKKGSKPCADFLFDAKYGKQTTPLEVDLDIVSVDWEILSREFDKSNALFSQNSVAKKPNKP
mgnify:CR=1 FL=1